VLVVNTVENRSTFAVDTYNGKKDDKIVHTKTASYAIPRVPSKRDNGSSKHRACYSWSQSLPPDLLCPEAG
jgi:hypothetical protein